MFGYKFWVLFIEFKVVFFYNNSIFKFVNVNYMVVFLSILILILYDILLSLKLNYRYYLVNSLWLLKFLDYYVIFDEEIIEDLFFGGCFVFL